MVQKVPCSLPSVTLFQDQSPAEVYTVVLQLEDGSTTRKEISQMKIEPKKLVCADVKVVKGFVKT